MQIATNFTRKHIIDFLMAWNGRRCLLFRVDKDSMTAPLAQELAPVRF